MGPRWPKHAPFAFPKGLRTFLGVIFFVQLLGPKLATFGPKRLTTGPNDSQTASSGARRVKTGPRLPHKPSQSVEDRFWAKPFLTIFGPKIGHFGGPVGWAARRVPPFPSVARHGVLRVRLSHSEGGNHQNWGVAVGESALGITMQAV